MPRPTPSAAAEVETMTLQELAQRWDTHYSTVWELARRNKLPVPVFRVGRRYLVSRKAYEALMATQHEPQAQSA